MSPAGGAPPQGGELAPHYYRDNFSSLLQTVEQQYADLLNPAELAIIGDWRQADFEAQCLYVRLVSRVGPWFRESRLHYPELESVGEAVDELLSCGLAVQATGLELQELDRLYTRPELDAAFDCGSSSRSKLELMEKIAALGLPAERCLAQLRPLDDSRVLAPTGAGTVDLLQVLFFGNRYQGLTDFVLSDLGVARYFPYALDRSARLFRCREALDEYLYLAGLSDRARDLIDAGETEALSALGDEILLLSPEHATSSRRWSRLCNGIARQLERQGGDGLALALYGRSAAHPSRERSARLLEKATRWAESLSLCDEILARPWCEEERDAVTRIRPRLLRKLEGGKMSRSRDDFPEVRLELHRGEAPVELLVAEHLLADWASVHFVENSLMNALFGLAFWEEIFMSVPGAFNNPFQSAPSDMYEPGFVPRRREAIEARLAVLEERSLAEELPAAWRRYQGYQCRWVNWRDIDEQLVASASARIPRTHLLAIWRRMLFDPRENRRGFPDLLALGEQQGEYRMIEVKGPGDALQDSQKRWLRFFRDQAIPAQVAWVSWRDE